ncbi:MAG TPA: AAA family ATPase, partial [Dehalococcoidia bacterium]|nr:AAA family ATPase [Dehalococcoidia bacterium]
GDFGLAVALDRSRLTMAGTMVGTAAYMPPEQALGGEATYRSDLYSLGCVLYEMVTGRPPFLGDDTLGIISQHVNAPPLAPSWHKPDVPPALDALILRLLRKSPDERPASAADVITALASIASAPAAEAPAAPPSSAPPRPPVVQNPRSPFVAREKELGQLKDRLEAALAAQGSLVMLVGEPGIGKTRLTEELSVYARLRGAQVLLGQCYEAEGQPPYIPFIEALRQYVNSRPPEALREEMGDGASDIAKLVSEVRARLPDLPRSPSQEPESERYKLLEAVTSFLVNASLANPLLLVLDDIHWADKPSLLLLETLARRLSNSRLLVVGTYRDVELDRRHPLSEVVAQLRRERLYERILLRGLDVDGVQAFLNRRAEGQADRTLVAALAAALHEQTEGNPFFIEEIIFHLYEIGAIYRQEGQWLTDPALVAQNIPEGVREVIGRRLSLLSEGANQALTFASVLGREFEFDVLQALTEMEEDALLASLEEALDARLLEERRGAGGAAYRFSHALVRETLYGELSIARKQRFHLRAGQALERSRAGRLEAYVSQLANHFYQGNDPVKAIDYARRAGDAAVKLYAWEEAIRHWETALELMEEQGANEAERAELLARLGDTTYVSGIDLDKGTAFLEKALAIYERMGARGKVAATHSRLGRGLVSYFGRMDLEKGPAHLEAARAILEEDAAHSAGLAYVYIGLCTACLLRAEMEKGIAYSRRALAIGEKLNSRPVTAIALVFTGNFLGHMGEMSEGLQSIERSWAIADEDGLTFVAFLGAMFSGAHHVFTRSDPGEAKRWLQRELAKPRLASAPILRRMLLMFLGSAHIIAGEMDEARRLAEDVTDSGLRGALLIASGEWDTAEERLLAGLDEYSRTGVSFGPSGFLFRLAELCFRRGEHGRAEEYLRAYSLALEQARGWLLDSRLALARVLARTGRPEEAQDELDKCASLLAGDQDWGGTAGHVALARGAVLCAERKWAKAAEAFGEALAVARDYGLPWDEADALHEGARMHMARGGKGDLKSALTLLDETASIYQRLGAKKHLELVLADKLQAQGVDRTHIQTSIDAVAASVQAERPDMRPHAAPDGTVTIMFSDIEGSTAMTERLGDKVWMDVLRQHNAIVREQLKAHAGFEVKSEGDGFMVAFQSARRALDCAVDIQRALAARNEKAEEPVRARIGLHTGETIKEGEDFFGRNVILAARIAGQASGGEILVSSVLKALVDSAGDIAWCDPRTAELKGLSGRHDIWPVAWTG